VPDLVAMRWPYPNGTQCGAILPTDAGAFAVAELGYVLGRHSSLSSNFVPCLREGTIEELAQVPPSALSDGLALQQVERVFTQECPLIGHIISQTGH